MNQIFSLKFVYVIITVSVLAACSQPGDLSVSSHEDALYNKVNTDSDTDGTPTVDEDGDGNPNNDDGIPRDPMNENDHPEAEEPDEDEEDDVRCIGNGIKVLESNVVSCSSAGVAPTGNSGRCVKICLAGVNRIVTFKDGRGLLGKDGSGPATEGACQ